MAEDNPKENSIRFEEQAKGFAVGDHNIIYNYFGYSEEVKAASVYAPDDNLTCPYRGLYHFNPNDAEFFFGRDVFVEELFQATQIRNFIPVLGASGSGKSSVVLAGLIPKLEQKQKGHWKFTHFRPGSDPFHALALALVPLYRPESDATDEIIQARKLAKSLSNDQDSEDKLPLSDVFAKIKQNNPNYRILLIADQFEELYTQCSDPIVRHRFLDCLLTSFQSPNSGVSSSTVLVTTMRADFLANALSYRPFADMLQNADIKLGAMSREELTEVIEKPADKLGVSFEAGLVERILNDVEDEPGNLPLLEFALTELWKKRTGKQLTHNAYKAIGQVKGALANYADDKYKNLTKEEKEQARRIFIQLVRPGEGTEDTRRRASSAELGKENWDLITRKNGLADSRLVVTGRNDTEQETVEVVHEALIQNWDQLREWMETDRKFRVWQESLRITIQKYNSIGNDKGALLRGVPLAEAEQWQQKRLVELSSEEISFIKRSREEQERIQAEKTRLRRRAIQWLSGGLAVALVAGGIAAWQWQRAQRQLKQLKIAFARQLAIQSEWIRNQYPDSHETSALLAVESMKRFQKMKEPSVEADQALRQSLKLLPTLHAQITHQEILRTMAFSPNGKYLATGGDDNIVIITEVKTGKEITRINHQGVVNAVAFSPDSKYLATASGDIFSKENTSVLIEIKTGKEITHIKHQEQINAVAFSPDSKYLATASNDKTARITEVKTGEGIIYINHQEQVNDVAFSPNGKYLATASGNFPDGAGTVRLIEVKTNKEIALINYSKPVHTMTFSPDNKYLATASDDKIARIAEVKTGKEILINHRKRVNAVAFSPNGEYLATASDDKTARITEIKTNKGIALINHQDEVNDAAFSPNGEYLATASDDKTARITEIKTNKEIALINNPKPVYAITFSPDSEYLATRGEDNTARIAEVKTGKEIARINQQKRVTAIEFSPDGKYLATASNGKGKTARITEVKTGEGIIYINHQRNVKVVKSSFKVELKRPNTSGQGWQNYPMTWTSDIEQFGVTAIEFSPNGEYLATASYDKTARVTEIKTGQEIALINHQKRVNGVAFSPNGKYLATASDDKFARITEIKTDKKIYDIHHQYSVNAVAFSPNGKYLATASGNFADGDGTVRLIEVETNKEIFLINDKSSVRAVAFSSDGKYLATVSGNLEDRDGTVRLIEVETGKEIRSINQQGGLITLVFSPDGKYLATVSGISITGEDHTVVRLIKVETGQEIHSINQQGGLITLAFSPDGKYLATGARISDVKTGQEIALINHQAPVRTMAFSPDSKYLATASYDKTTRISDVKTGKEMVRINHQDLVNAVAFSPDGKYLTTGSNDNIAQVQFVYPENLMAEACGRLKRNLSLNEWRDYVNLPLFPYVNFPLFPSYDKTCKDYPIHWSFLERAKNWAEKKNVKSAIWLFRQIEKFEPEIDLNPYTKELETDPEAVAKQFAAPVIVEEAISAAKEEKMDEAIALFKKAQTFFPQIDLNPNTDEVDQDPEKVTKNLTASAIRQQADQLARNGKIEEAIKDYNKAIEIDSNYIGAYNNRGIIYLSQKKWDLALADFNKVIEIEPNYAGAYNNRAIIYLNQEKWDLALADFNKVIEIEPNYAGAYYNRAKIWIELNNKQKAINDLQTSAQLHQKQGNMADYQKVMDMIEQIQK